MVGEASDTPGATEAEAQQAREERARGEKTAENVRYGEAISEHGMGGETTGLGGVGGSQGVHPSIICDSDDIFIAGLTAQKQIRLEERKRIRRSLTRSIVGRCKDMALARELGHRT